MENTLAQWLESHELSKYLDVLLSNDIDTIELVKSLTTDDLKELGVSLGDRKRFEKAFQDNGKSFTDFEKEVISQYPYVIAYPFKRMLEEEDGRNRLELMAYSFLNLMKYLGLVLASEYFHSPVRSRELNELFRNNLYQPSFGNWNAFIRDAIKVLSAQELNWIFPALKDAYTQVEIKNPKKYKVESEYTDEDGLLKWRQSDLTAIGALINFRNRYLGHGMPLSKEEYAGLYQTVYPIYTDLLTAFAFLKEMQMIKSDRLNQYLLQGDEVQVLPKTDSNQADLIWIQQNEGQVLPLIPFYIIPGKFNAGHTDKTQVLVYEQNTGQRMVFYSPESIKAEATGEILERLQLLLESKEREEPSTKESFTAERFHDRLRISNDKVLQGLKKERKVIEGTYQSRGEAEIALMGWTGAVAGFFFLAAEAGSGKTNLLVHVAERYQALEFPTLLLRGNRMEHANLHQEIGSQLNIPPDANLTEYGIVGNREKPFMILLDGANEHPASLELLASAAALADAYPGGGLKVVVSWRVNHLDQVPDCTFKDVQTLFNAGDCQHPNPLAAAAHLLKPMNLVEVEGAWKHYANHPSKLFRPQFGYDELVLADKPLVDQFSNPLLLRLFMEIFHNKGLKSKPKGFTNLWKLWWQRISEQAGEADYLQQLAALLAETRSLQVPLDKLFDHPELSRSVNNLQVDSPHQQLLRKGVISQYFHDGVLQVSFTMEAACQYVLSLSMKDAELSTLVKADSFWEGPVRFRLWDSVYDADASLLFELIDDEDFPNALAGFALAQFVLLHGPEKALNRLLENPSAHDWEVLETALKALETNRPKEHLALANQILQLTTNDFQEESRSLVIGLLPFGDKSLSDEVFKLHIENYEMFAVEELKSMAAYHDKYGRNKQAMACLEKAIQLIEKNQKDKTQPLVQLYRLLSEQQMELGSYKAASASLDQAGWLQEANGQMNKMELAQLKSTRGKLYEHQSLHKEALTAFQSVKTLCHEVVGPFHQDALKALFNLSGVYLALGNYEQSMKLTEEGIRQTEKALGKANPIYSDFVQNLGDLYNEKGLYDDALTIFNQALDIELEYFGSEHPSISGSFDRIGGIWNTKGDYDKALDYFERAMAICLQYYGESHPNVGVSLDSIGDIWNTKGDYDKALDYFERAMAIRLQYYGESHPNVGVSLDSIGDIWNTKGDYDKALDYFERAMAIRLQYYGESHPNVGVSLDRIGDIWETKGEYDKALDYFERSMAIDLQYYGESHPNVGVSLDRIGGIWNTKGDYDKALDYFERSMAIRLQYYGESHPNVAISLNRIGGIWNTKGEYDKALDYFERSMAIRLQYYGESHPDVGFSLDRIGGIWNTKGDYDKALDYFERAMAIDLQYYGESHPNVATSLNRIGDIWNTKGDYDKALDYFERAMDIRLQYYGESHPNVGVSLDRIGGIWNTKGDYDKALDYFERAMAIDLQYYGESHPNVGVSLDRIGGIWNTKGDYDKALDYFERSMAIRLQYYGESHPNVGVSLDRIGGIWNTKGDYDMALDYFERSMAIDLQYYGETHPNVATSLNRIGDIWETKGEYDKALDYFERSMAIRLQYYGESHPNVATSLSRIGDIWETKGEYDKALDYFERSMAIRLQYYGESHPNVATSLSRIGGIWNTKGDYDKALDYFERSMDIRLQYYGESHPNVGVSLDRIGGIWNTKGDYDKALDYFERAMAIDLQYYGESHPNVATSLSRIGDIWETKGEYDKALDYFERSMAIRLQYYGESHPNVATSLNRIGDIWNTKGDYDKALDYFERAMDIRLQYYGESHPNVGVSLDRIGGIWNTKGDYDKALDYFERAMAIDLQYYGESHPNVGVSLDRIGGIWNTKGDYDKALDYFERSMAIDLQYYGESHPNVATSLNRIGDIWETKGEYDKALDYFERAMAIDLQYYGESHPNVGVSLDRIGDIWNTKGDYDKALDYFERAMAIDLQYHGESHPNVATSLSRIGDIWETKGEYDKALDYFERSMAIRLQYYGESHPNVAISLNRIGGIWNTKGEYDKALDYFERAMAIDLQYYGESHPNVGWSRVRLGEIFQKQDQLDKAITEFMISLEIMEKAYGNESRDAAKVKRRIGFVKVLMGQVEEGIGLINQSIETLKSSGLEKDVSLATAYMNLSTGYRLQKNLSNALLSIELAIEIYHENRGTFHIDTAEVYVEYAHILQAMGNVAAAQSHFQKAYEIRLAKLGEAHPDTIHSASFLNKP